MPDLKGAPTRNRNRFSFALALSLLIIFVAVGARAQDAPGPPAQTPFSSPPSELEMWGKIADSTNPNDYLAFLKQYPDGTFAPLAKTRVESYAVGFDFALTLLKQPVDIDVDSLLRGLQDEMSGGKTVLTDRDANSLLADLQSHVKPNSTEGQRIAAGEKGSYALGMNFGRKLKHQPIDLDPASVARAMKDTLSADAPPLLNGETVESALRDLQMRIKLKQDEQRSETEELNRKKGADFLTSNKSNEGVVALPDGLQYKILTQGAGPKPSADDTVLCNFHGTQIDGTEFDSTPGGQPASLKVSALIPGWAQALQMMPVGSRWQLFIPPELAYGNDGNGADVGPGATVIVEVELVAIQGK